MTYRFDSNKRWSIDKGGQPQKPIDLIAYKNEALKVSRELKYDVFVPDIFEKINNAKTVGEVSRALINARHEYFKNL